MGGLTVGFEGLMTDNGVQDEDMEGWRKTWRVMRGYGEEPATLSHRRIVSVYGEEAGE